MSFFTPADFGKVTKTNTIAYPNGILSSKYISRLRNINNEVWQVGSGSNVGVAESGIILNTEMIPRRWGSFPSATDNAFDVIETPTGRVICTCWTLGACEFYYSDDYGNTWNACTVGGAIDAAPYVLAVNPAGQLIAIPYGGNNWKYSHDNGLNFLASAGNVGTPTGPSASVFATQNCAYWNNQFGGFHVLAPTLQNFSLDGSLWGASVNGAHFNNQNTYGAVEFNGETWSFGSTGGVEKIDFLNGAGVTWGAAVPTPAFQTASETSFPYQIRAAIPFNNTLYIAYSNYVTAFWERNGNYFKYAPSGFQYIGSEQTPNYISVVEFNNRLFWSYDSIMLSSLNGAE